MWSWWWNKGGKWKLEWEVTCPCQAANFREICFNSWPSSTTQYISLPPLCPFSPLFAALLPSPHSPIYRQHPAMSLWLGRTAVLLCTCSTAEEEQQGTAHLTVHCSGTHEPKTYSYFWDIVKVYNQQGNVEVIPEVIVVQAYIVPQGCLQIHNHISEWQNQICGSQLPLPQCFAGHKSEVEFPAAPNDLNSLLAASIFIAPKTQPLLLKWWQKDVREKRHKEKNSLRSHPYIQMSKALCNCYLLSLLWEKHPSDSLSVFLGSIYYSGTRQKQRSCVSYLPIVET